jgi:cytochrome c biogenesis protein CcmG, thiol:disulfide interchange protein DsbE
MIDTTPSHDFVLQSRDAPLSAYEDENSPRRMELSLHTPSLNAQACADGENRRGGIRSPTMRLILALATSAILIHPTWTQASAAPGGIDLRALRGRVVYLDFWASWCTPCRKSFPWMESLESSFGGAGLTVIAVNVDSDRADAERFLAEFRPDFDVRFDPGGALAERFKVMGMPTSLIIDRHGVVRYRHIGFLPAEAQSYDDEVRQLLDER